MTKIILAVNAGSSSVKVSVFEAAHNTKPKLLGEAQVSGLTAPPATLSFSRGDDKIINKEKPKDNVSSQDDAFALLLKTLVESDAMAEIKNDTDISIVTNRIVHGGDYAAPEIISRETFNRLQELTDLAPLHNTPALSIVRSCAKHLPHARLVACFDSQFHASLPPHVRTYPIDQAIATKNKLRKYGFHGLSYSFVVRRVAESLGKPVNEVNLIALHLGSGASACAVKNGRSIDTSMGLTPLAGLPGATRSGSLDPSLVFHYASNVGRLAPGATRDLHISRAEHILNKEAGWQALAGTTDFAAIAEGATAECRLAFNVFVNRVAGYVGSYFVALHGRVDALVFAGGIGERSAQLRAAVGREVACLGLDVDEAQNAAVGDLDSGEVVRVGDKVLVCATDEQMEMATLCTRMDALW